MWSVESITVGVGIIAALLSLLVFWLMCTNLVVGVASVLLLLVCETVYVAMPAIRLGILVYPQDFIFAMLAVVAALRFSTVRSLREIPRLWLVLVLLLFVNFGVGLARYGSMAGVEFRPYFYTLTGALYVMSFPAEPKSYRTIFTLWIVAALSVCAVAFYRWTMIALGLEDYAWLDTTGIEGRVINSSQALVLTTAVAITLFGLLRKVVAKGWLMALPLLLVTIAGSQQRTVWVATAASLLLVVVLAGQRRGSLLTVLGIVGTLGVAVAYPLATSGRLDSAASSISTTASAGMSTRTGTFVGRVGAWKESLKEYASWNPLYQMVGKQFGVGYSVWLGTKEFGNAPHNYYIQTMLRAGFIGVVALIGTYLLVLRRLFSVYGPMEGAARVLWVAIAVEMVYSITYSPTFVQSIVYGAALAIAAQFKQQPLSDSLKTANETNSRPAYLS
jgi:O-Antigen ligase